jgi:hypothetical protein
VKRDGHRTPHHVQKNAYTSQFVKSFERSDEFGKRSRLDANPLSLPQPCIAEGQAGFIHILNQGLHDPPGDRDRTIVAGKESRNPHRAAYRQPTVALQIKYNEKVSRE